MGVLTGKKVTVARLYHFGRQDVLCLAPIEKISRIVVDDKEVWSGVAQDGDQIVVDKPELFGGQGREGGISGPIDFNFGYPDQEPNEYLVEQLGEGIPAGRGWAQAVLRRVYHGTTGYSKKWAYLAKRIHVAGREGDVQWYDAKAEIFSEAQLAEQQQLIDEREAATEAAADWADSLAVGWDDSFEYSVYDENEDTEVGWTNAPQPFGDGVGGTAVDTVCDWQIHQRRIIDIPLFYEEQQVTIRLNFSSDDGGQATWDGFGAPQTQPSFASGGRRRHHLIFFYSPPGQGINYTAPGEHILLTKVKNCRADDFITPYGSATNIYSNIDLISVDIDFPPLPVYDGDMNPAHVIRELLTDKRFGIRRPASEIDDDSFMAAADQLFDEKMGVSFHWVNQSSVEDFIAEVLRHIDATLYIDRATGKYVLKLIRDDYDVETLPVLNVSNIVSVTEYSRTAPGDLVNQVTIIYNDRENRKNGSLSLHDAALVQRDGGIIDQTLRYPGFTNQGIVGRVLSRDLRQLSNELLTATIEAKGVALQLNPGDPFVLDWSPVTSEPTIMRVLQPSYSRGLSRRVRLTCTQDVFALPANSAIGNQDSMWENPAGEPPGIAEYRMAMEAPYFELAGTYGQAQTDSLLASDPDIGELYVAAALPSNAVLASIATDDGGGYTTSETATLDFCPSALLAADVEELDTAWTIESGSALEEVAVGSLAIIGSEFLRVDAIDGDAGTLTVGRVVLDSVPAKHIAGTPILFLGDFVSNDGKTYADGESVNVKILPSNTAGALSIDDAPADSVTFDRRAVKPYPPGNVKINDQYFPSLIATAMTITWAHRDRSDITQFVDFTDADVGPEAGTTYNGYLYNDDNDALLFSETGISSGWQPPLSGAYNLRLELESVRGGHASYYRFTHVFTYINGYGGATLLTEDGDTLVNDDGDTLITED